MKLLHINLVCFLLGGMHGGNVLVMGGLQYFRCLDMLD